MLNYKIPRKKKLQHTHGNRRSQNDTQKPTTTTKYIIRHSIALNGILSKDITVKV